MEQIFTPLQVKTRFYCQQLWNALFLLLLLHNIFMDLLTSYVFLNLQCSYLWIFFILYIEECGS